ncbi:MAG TPA: hypothetical protein VME20_00370 [Acidimicrobiales bacterium]|nr:hypothetical protein [Acidimicrobiales bacterium]
MAPLRALALPAAALVPPAATLAPAVAEFVPAVAEFVPPVAALLAGALFVAFATALPRRACLGTCAARSGPAAGVPVGFRAGALVPDAAPLPAARALADDLPTLCSALAFPDGLAPAGAAFLTSTFTLSAFVPTFTAPPPARP